MASSKGNKYYNVFQNYTLWLVPIDNHKIMNDAGLMLLLEIRKSESIKLAAEKIAISYRKAWNTIKNSENTLGFKLEEKERGGKVGGHTSLSPEGEDLAKAYIEHKDDISFSIKKVTKKFFNQINKKNNKPSTRQII